MSGEFLADVSAVLEPYRASGVPRNDCTNFDQRVARNGTLLERREKRNNESMSSSVQKVFGCEILDISKKFQETKAEVWALNIFFESATQEFDSNYSATALSKVLDIFATRFSASAFKVSLVQWGAFFRFWISILNSSMSLSRWLIATASFVCLGFPSE